MTIVRRQKKDRRKELILIAYHHIATKGFEGLRVREVAAEAAINNATLHYYFPTKEDLNNGVVDYMIHQFSMSFFPAVEKKEALDAWAERRAELEDAWHRFRVMPDQFVVYIELLVRSFRDPSMAQIFKKLDEGWENTLVRIIEKGISQGVFGKEIDPTAMTILIMLQIKGMGLQMLVKTKREIADKVFEQLILQVESWLTNKVAGRPERFQSC